MWSVALTMAPCNHSYLCCNLQTAVLFVAVAVFFVAFSNSSTLEHLFSYRTINDNAVRNAMLRTEIAMFFFLLINVIFQTFDKGEIGDRSPGTCNGHS